jgi:hypothetical protein
MLGPSLANPHPAATQPAAALPPSLFHLLGGGGLAADSRSMSIKSSFDDSQVCLLLQLVDSSIRHPKGIVKTLLVKIREYYVFADFVILDVQDDTGMTQECNVVISLEICMSVGSWKSIFG